MTKPKITKNLKNNKIEAKRKRNISGPLISINALFILISLVCIIPIMYIVSISLSNDIDIAKYGYNLIPKKLSFYAYKYIFLSPKMILNAYKISIMVTIGGTLLNLLVSSMIAYTLSRRDFRYRNIISFFVMFTMLFNGGLVPWYILIVNYLHLKNTILVLILPYVGNALYILILKSFMMNIPSSLYDSGKMDGASEYTIFFKIVVPLSKPALATVGLFYLLTYWNDWWLGLLYIEKTSLVPLQLMLANIMNNIEYLAMNMRFIASQNMNMAEVPNESARMAICVLAAGPMLFVFPFFQKYFVKGLIVGSVKG